MRPKLLGCTQETSAAGSIEQGARSNKDQGWTACVAHNAAELAAIAASLLTRERRSRGKIIVRRLVSICTLESNSRRTDLWKGSPHV